MARAETQRLKLLYLYDYFHRCTDEDHPASIAALQAYLKTLQIPAERKTLYTDLQLLQEFGLDLVRVREGHHFSYYLGSRAFELPEVRLLVDAVQSSRFLTEKKSAALIRKLAQLSSEHQAGLLESQVVVAGRVKTMDESIYYAVDAIQSAIAADCCIRFDYTEWGPDKQRHKRGPSRIATPWQCRARSHRSWRSWTWPAMGGRSSACSTGRIRRSKCSFPPAWPASSSTGSGRISCSSPSRTAPLP